VITHRLVREALEAHRFAACAPALAAHSPVELVALISRQLRR
jgi:hypothetical protein